MFCINSKKRKNTFHYCENILIKYKKINLENKPLCKIKCLPKNLHFYKYYIYSKSHTEYHYLLAKMSLRLLIFLILPKILKIQDKAKNCIGD